MLRPKKRYYLKRQTAKTAAKAAIRRQVLGVYYDTLVDRCTHSEESGEPIPNPSRMNVCHLLPKRKYKSVQDNLDNYVYLLPQEHITLDRLLDILDFEAIQKEFPNSWSIICDRVKKLLPQVRETGKLKIKFQDYLESSK